MQKKEDLILENTELRARLSLAEKWMRREVAMAIKHVQEDGYRKTGRKKLHNVLEEEHLDIITRRIIELLGNSLEKAPKYTLERLIDAEIYWSTLQQYPSMDALPIILAYQKILDAWIEENLISPWRKVSRGNMKYENGKISDVGIEKDLQSIIHREYTLSIGRLYQILELARQNTIKGPLLSDLLGFWKRGYSCTLDNLLSDAFFISFQDLMNREIFTRKRHESKVTYSDAKISREILIDGGLLSSLFSGKESQ